MEERFKMIVDVLEHGSMELFHFVKRLKPESLLIPPSEQAWNIAQIVQHIHLSDKGARYAMMRNTEPCTDRDPLETLLNYEAKRNAIQAKLQAPEKVLPAAQISLEEIVTILKDFIQTRRAIVDLLNQSDLDVTALCKALPHPRIGEMTRIEWARFIDWHARHHLVQIKNIVQFVPGVEITID